MKSEGEVRARLKSGLFDFEHMKEWTLLTLTADDIRKMLQAYNLIESVLGGGGGKDAK